MNTRILLTFSILVVMLDVSACSAGNSKWDMQDGSQDTPATTAGNDESLYVVGYGPLVTCHLPYLEDISWPDDIIVNESFTIAVHISSDLNPDVLLGLDTVYNDYVCLGFDSREDENLGLLSLAIDLWVAEPLGGGSPVDELRYEVAGLPEGEYKLFIRTAESPEWGGMRSLFAGENPWWPLREHEVRLQYEITVGTPGGAQE